MRTIIALMTFTLTAYAESPPLPPWSPTPAQADIIEGRVGEPVAMVFSGGSTNIVAITTTNMPPPPEFVSKTNGVTGGFVKAEPKPAPDPRYVVTAWSELDGLPIEVTIRVAGETGFFKPEFVTK